MFISRIKPVFKFILLGAFIGVFVLHPFTMAIYWFEFNPPDSISVSLFSFLIMKISSAFSGEMLFMTFIFLCIGICLGLAFWLYHKNLSLKQRMIYSLSRELDRDIYSLIEKGESERLEFKSSTRWDYRQGKINKALELVIVKTIAGFMNCDGGTLLIGLDDEGKALGLEQDYNTLKKKNHDGYEQLIIGLISSYIATDQCHNISVVFHHIEDQEICRVIIFPSQRPVFCLYGKSAQFFLRTGGGTRELNVKEATEYIADHWHS